jgi:hypothetical protein
MTLTENLIDGSGSNTYNFSFPILDQQDVKVQLREFDPNLLPEDQIISQISTTAFDVLSSPNRVVFTPIADETIYQDANGDVKVTSSNGYQVIIRIYRDTDIDGTAAYFYPGSAIRAEDLNDNFRQLLFNAQESAEELEDILAGIFPDESIPGSALKDGSVTTEKIADGAVTPDKLDREYVEPGDNVSELVNDANYVSVDDNVSDLVNDANYISVGDNVSDLVNDADYLSVGDNVSDLVNDLEYLEPGDNVSELTNDAGYITAAEVPPTGVTKLIAGNNVTISPSTGTGVVTVNSIGGGGSGTATIGAIVAWANSTVPTGWLECDGSPIPAQYSDLIALVGANTPDLRGEFVRGWDNGAGVDTGRALLSNQVEGVNPSNLKINAGGNESGSTGSLRYMGSLGGIVDRSGLVNSVDTETRPRNVALMYIINADGSSIGGGGGGSGVSSIIAGDGISVDQATGDVTITNTGGGGGDGDTIIQNYSGASAWANFEADGTINAGLNVASVTRVSAGKYDVVLATPMPDSFYSVTLGGRAAGVRSQSQTPTGFRIETFNAGGSLSDLETNFTIQSTNSLPPRGGTGTDSWATVDKATSNGACVVPASFNVASVTRTATGTYDVLFTTPMPTARYAVTGSIAWPSLSNGACNVLGDTRTDGFTIQLVSNAPAFFDYGFSFTVNATNATLPLTITQEQIESAINNPGASAWGSVQDNATLDAGLNIASVTRTSQGKYKVVFTTPMPDSFYSITTSAANSSIKASYFNRTATGFEIYTTNNSGSTDGGFSFTVFATNNLPPKGGTGTDSWATVDFTTSNGPCNVPASFNVASVTRTSQGKYDVVFNTPMPTANYSIQGSAENENSNTAGKVFAWTNKTATGFRATIRSTNDSLQDTAFSFSVNATNATLPTTFTEAQIQSVLDFIAVANPAGVAKAWGAVSEDGTLTSGLNIASVDRGGATSATYEITFSSPMPDTTYSIVGSAVDDAGKGREFNYSAKTATGFSAVVRNPSSGGGSPGDFSFTVHSN